MKNKKVILLCLFALVLVILPISIVSATSQIFSINNSVVGYLSIENIHQSATSNPSMGGESFLYSSYNNSFIYGASFNLSRVGTPDGFLYAEIYTVLPNGLPYARLEQSFTGINMMDVGGTTAKFTFYFSGSFNYSAYQDSKLYVGVGAYNGTNLSTSNYINVAASSTTYPNGGDVVYYSSAWWVIQTIDFSTTVFGSDIVNPSTPPNFQATSTPTPTDTPTPTGTPTPTPYNPFGWINILFSSQIMAVLTMVAMFGLIFGCGALGFYAMKSGFGGLVGINIGIILGYAIPTEFGYSFIPIWGVIIIIVVDAIYGLKGYL